MINYTHISADRFKHPIEPLKVIVIGAGGNGSFLIRELARLSNTLRALDHAGLHVTIYDPKLVNEISTFRQDFYNEDIDQYKSIALANRMNRLYGTNWKGIPTKFNPKEYSHRDADIIITCVDENKARLQVQKLMRNSQIRQVTYWIDSGNGKDFGQVVVGGCGLKTVFDLYPAMIEQEDKNEPSCSVRESLSYQDFLINRRISTEITEIVETLLTKFETNKQGVFIIKDKIAPILITYKQ